ncbi:hypothetical protein N7461_002824 [Penicillium sp. DV-2018c]|nr:hypothetical protein N7461_002824 [Penicillium sp. DV-2018c]
MELLLALMPLLGFISGALKWNSAVVFLLNILSLAPLGSWINRSIDTLAISGGRTVNEILKSTMGNSVELMIGANAIVQRRPHICQSVILGSVLSNLLLVNPQHHPVLGGTILVSGYDQKRLRFDRGLTTVLSSLMMVVFILLALPTITEIFSSTHATSADQVLFTQRIISVILVVLLLTFFVFRLRTHAFLFAGTPFGPQDQIQGGHELRQDQVLDSRIPQSYIDKALGAFILAIACISAFTCTYYVVSSLSGFAVIVGTNQAFIAVTLIPLFGNAVKYYSIIIKSRLRRQVELGIRAVINTVLRVTMLIAPLLVLLGWARDEPLTLRFDPFEATTLLLSVVIMSYLISDGRTNYFEGLMLIGTYAIIISRSLFGPSRRPM